MSARRDLTIVNHNRDDDRECYNPIKASALLLYIINYQQSKMVEPLRIAILGAGHAGRALAGYLALFGNEVTLHNRTLQNILAIKEAGGVHVTGVIEGFAQLSCVSDDMAEVVLGSDIIVVTVPAQAHRFVAYELSTWISDGQTVLIMPGATGGALEFSRIFEQCVNLEDVLLGEAQTFSFVSRIVTPTTVLVSKIKNTVRVSALPATDNQKFVQSLSRIPLSFEPAESVLETSLGNVNAMLHPVPMLLNAGLIETQGGGFLHYHDLISKTIGKLIEAIDNERVAIAKALGVHSATLLEWLTEVYDANGETLYDCLRSIDTYDHVSCATDLNHRYIHEDIPTGLVPLASLGDFVGVSTPTIDTMIDLADHIFEKDFRQIGRTVDSLGLSDMSISDLKNYVELTIKDSEYHEVPIYGREYSV